MSWWTRFTGGTNPRDAAVARALADQRATRSELLDVVNELEKLVARLSTLPEVQAAKQPKKKGGAT